MSAEHLILKLVRSDAHFRGNYSDNAFELLAAPTPLYRNLLKQLSQFGANFQNFKAETPSLAESHISCSLPDLNTVIRVRLDRIEIDCWRFHEIGAEAANRIVLATWAAIRNADNSMALRSHVVDVNILAEIEAGTCFALMGRYVRTPEVLGVVDVGVAFYSRPIQKTERWMNVVLDRVFGQDNQILLKITVGLDGAEVTLDALALQVENSINTTLNSLGLHFRTDDKK